MPPIRYFLGQRLQLGAIVAHKRGDARVAARVNAGNTATWAMCPRPTTAYLTGPLFRLAIRHLNFCSVERRKAHACKQRRFVTSAGSHCATPFHTCVMGRGYPRTRCPLQRLTVTLIERLYAQCGSFYDRICGPMLQAGRREAMRELALRPTATVIFEIGNGVNGLALSV